MPACTAARRLARVAARSTTDSIRCPYHGWCYALDGRLVDVSDRDDSTACPTISRSRAVRSDTWGGFVFVNLDPDAEPLLDFLDPLPDAARAVPPRTDAVPRVLRRRSSTRTGRPSSTRSTRATTCRALHPQILPWTDDVSIEYEQFERHAHYGRLPGRAASCGPVPGSACSRATTTKARSSPDSSAGLGRRVPRRGARRSSRSLRCGAAPARACRCSRRIQARRRELLAARGFDVSGSVARPDDERRRRVLLPERRRTDLSGHARSSSGSARTGSTPKRDQGHVGARVAAAGDDDGKWEQRFFPDWNEKDWGEITEQDYANCSRSRPACSRAGSGAHV